MKKIITVDDITGNVLSEWNGGDEQSLVAVAGRTHIEVRDKKSYGGQRWTGTAFTPISIVPPPEDPQIEQLWRIESKIDFLISKP